LTCDLVIWDLYGAAQPPYYYNLGLNNEQVINRRSGYLHQSAQQYFEGQADQFKVIRPQATYKATDAGIVVNTLLPYSGVPVNSTFDPIGYNNDTAIGTYNNGGNYNIGTFKYTCPTTGDYVFNHTLLYTTWGIAPPFTILNQTFRSQIIITAGLYNTTAIPGPIAESAVVMLDNNNGSLTASRSMPCTAGDVIQSYIRFQFTAHDLAVQPQFGVTFDVGSSFSCTSTPSGGGGVKDLNTEDFKALLFKFEYPLTGTELRTLVTDPTQLITITSNGETFKGWIDEVKNNDWENKAQITLRTNAIIQDT